MTNKATKVKFPVTNGFSNLVSNEFAFLHPHKITTNDLNAKLRLALASDQGITKHDIGLSERTVYKVYFKDGSSKFVDLKADIDFLNALCIKCILKTDHQNLLT